MNLFGVSRMGMEAELVIPEVAPLCEGPGASLSSVFLAFGGLACPLQSVRLS